MNRHSGKILSSVLIFVSVLSLLVMPAYGADLIGLTHVQKIIAGVIAVLSGYFAAYIRACGGYDVLESQKVMRRYLIFSFIFYIAMLIDFTLIDDGLGRNIFNVLSWDRSAFKEYINTSTNLIPFKTVRLFINGYKNGHLSLFAALENVLGNLLAFVPLPFFMKCLFGKTGKSYIFKVILLSVLGVEALQFLFLTGSADIDDVILNVSGAMLFFMLFNTASVSKVIEKYTIGVWEINEKEN